MHVPVKFEISVVQVGKSLKITIPVEVARHLSIEKGDTVELWVDNNHMIVEKKGKQKVDLDRKDDTIEDLNRNDMLGGPTWKSPRKTGKEKKQT